MREQVKEEMENIPRGDFSQNMLRLYYWALRMESKGKKSKNTNATKEDILRECIKCVKSEDQNFKAEYDRTYFRLK